jgi:hypothetical protein
VTYEPNLSMYSDVPTPPTGLPYMPPAPGEPYRDGLAIASFVLSILWLCGLGSVAALVLGYRSLAEARRLRRPASALTHLGMSFGWIGCALAIGIIIIIAIGSK